MSLALLSLAALCWGAASSEPTIRCGSEDGPSPEWTVHHALTPGDLRELRVEPVRVHIAPEEYSLLMNISWTLRADASIRMLKATKICVTSNSNFQTYSCVRCNYTESFLSQTRPSGGQWAFSYVGFPVALNTVYFIGSHNIPTANMNEDGPSLSVNFTSPERRGLGSWLPLLLPALLVATWVLVVGIYLLWRQEKTKKTSFPDTMLLPLIKVLVVYPSEICFQHTVCYLTEFLQNHCRSEVILEKWQKKKIAEMGLVQWLTAQKTAADKIIFLLSSDISTTCNGTCGQSECSPGENSRDLLPLAFNLFCSDLRSQTHLHKYMVVYFKEAETKDDYGALQVCPKYHLMKDAAAFCEELLHTEQQEAVGMRSQVCLRC